jgi:serine/threonine-protein kinase RsbW/stage II sporulation protein AB (anti-sigma F factor)
MDLCFDATPQSVPQARRAVACWAVIEGAAGGDLDRIRLAVSEAVTNAVVHAYSAPTGGIVRVTAGGSAGELTVLVADDGCGIGAAPESPGLGLGLGVIEECCDALTISSRAAGGIQLEMRFRLRGWEEPRALRLRSQVRGSVTSARRPA